MEKREGYKKTDIGWIPEDWELLHLGTISDISMGQSPSSTAYNEQQIGMPLIQGNADIKQRLSKPRVWTSQITKTCDVDDILMTVRAPVGAVAKSVHNACIGRGVCSIRATKTDRKYLYQILLSFEPTWGKIEQGSTFTAVNGKDIKGLNIPYPPLPEQKKIASILTTVDDKISSIDSQIQQTEQLKKGLMEKLLTEGIGHTEFKETEIGRIPKGWDVKKLNQMALDEKNSFVNGPFGSNLLSSELTNSGVPVIYIRDIVSKNYKWVSEVFVTSEKADELLFCNVQRNDVLITKVGMPPGQASIYPEDDRAIITQDVIRIRPALNVSSIFLAMILNSDYARREIKKIEITGTRTRFSLTEYKKIKLPFPSFEEQKQIATILSTVDDKIEVLNQKKTQYQTLKKGLSQQLLTGQMRVKI